MTMTHPVIGVDVSKDWIDVFDSRSSGRGRLAADRASLARFARSARGALVVLEPTGGYERRLMLALERAGTEYARVNPRQSREFARATGRLAKTDRVDAELLARMGRALELTPDLVPSPARRRLAALIAHRGDITQELRRAKNRAGQVEDDWIASQIAGLVRVLERRRKAAETEIAALIAGDPEISAPSLGASGAAAHGRGRRAVRGGGAAGAAARARQARSPAHREPRGPRTAGLRLGHTARAATGPGGGSGAVGPRSGAPSFSPRSAPRASTPPSLPARRACWKQASRRRRRSSPSPGDSSPSSMP